MTPFAMFLRGIGPAEIALVAVVLLLVFGATRLPKIGSSLGHSMRAFKSAITGQDEPEAEEETSGKKVNSAINDNE